VTNILEATQNPKVKLRAENCVNRQFKLKREQDSGQRTQQKSQSAQRDFIAQFADNR